MKKLRVVISTVMMLALCFTLSACGNKYASHYNATVMVSINTSDKASVSFGTFSGRYVAKLTNTGDKNVCLAYKATLEEGNIKVYYDYNGEKLNLFEIGTDDGSIEAKTEAFTSNKTIYIIIESDGKCYEGSFSFALEKSE